MQVMRSERRRRLAEPFSAMCETCAKLRQFRIESAFVRLCGVCPQCRNRADICIPRVRKCPKLSAPSRWRLNCTSASASSVALLCSSASNTSHQYERSHTRHCLARVGLQIMPSLAFLTVLRLVPIGRTFFIGRLREGGRFCQGWPTGC
jgi:hypothetical protein